MKEKGSERRIKPWIERQKRATRFILVSKLMSGDKPVESWYKKDVVDVEAVSLEIMESARENCDARGNDTSYELMRWMVTMCCRAMR